MSIDVESLDIPVVFIVFRRPDTTKLVFQRIAQMKPKRLLVIADGARPDREGEAARCLETRQIATAVTWECEVLTNFSEVNLGSRRRVVSGLEWAFGLVEQAIILEDDILPDATFFPFCAELLERYRDDERISWIGGFNVAADALKLPYDYCFSEMTPSLWGWATWRSRWKKYDEHMTSWPEVSESGMLADFFMDEPALRYWQPTWQKMYDGSGTWDAWDYQWIYMNVTTRGLCILPTQNLVSNIGYGEFATHTKDGRFAPLVSIGSIIFPIRHPPAVIASRSRDLLDLRIRGNVRLTAPKRALRKILRVLGSSLKLAAKRDGTTSSRIRSW